MKKKTEQEPKVRELSPDEAAPIIQFVTEKLREQAAKEKEHLEKYGHVRHTLHAEIDGRRLAAVGNEIFAFDQRLTFPDFLIEVYAKHLFGVEWMKAEASKPLDQQHPAMRWYDHLTKLTNKQPAREDCFIAFVPDGIMSSYLLMLYDLYVLRHHSSLQQEVVKRLKHSDQFQGARYELFVAATMIRAGFTIQYEDESDRTTTHPEFIAIHDQTEQRLAVEAKSRGRAGVLGKGGEREKPEHLQLGVRRNLLKSALKKDVNDPYVLFVDVNLPPEFEEIHGDNWGDEAKGVLERYAQRMGGNFPLNLAIFTNIPHHYGKPEQKRPEESIKIMHVDRPKLPVKHPQVLDAIAIALMRYGKVPNEFPDDRNRK